MTATQTPDGAVNAARHTGEGRPARAALSLPDVPAAPSRLIRIDAADGLGYYDEAAGHDVWVARLYDLTPIFHKRMPWMPWTGATYRGWSVRTACGREIHYTRWALADHTDRIEREHGHHIPLRHAVRIGRPCKRCWP